MAVERIITALVDGEKSLWLGNNVLLSLLIDNPDSRHPAYVYIQQISRPNTASHHTRLPDIRKLNLNKKIPTATFRADVFA